MKILIIPSVSIKSGTGLRLLGIAKSLRKLGYKVEIAETKRQKFFSHADVVFASKTLWGSCIPSLFRKFFKNDFLILDIDDLEWGYWDRGKGYLRILMKYLMILNDKIFPLFFNVVTTHTPNLKSYIIKNLRIPEKKIIFLPQGIDFSLFKNIKWKPSKQKKIVYAAYLGPAAWDVDVIFKVFKEVLKEEKNVKLQIIGSGPYLKYFKNLTEEMGISNAVEFLGYVEHESIPQIISEASVAVNYLRDNFANQYRSSIKVREYLAAGIPTICNTIGDISLFSDYVYSFPTEDNGIFKKQILKALKNPDKEKARRGREFVRKNFDWDVIIAKFKDDLNNFMGS